MKDAVDVIESVVEQLNERVRELERRVSVLEGEEKPRPAKPAVVVKNVERVQPPATWRGFPPLETPTGVVPVFGKAVLGIAGAYFLRAIAESGAVPKFSVLTVAILYACLWMVWSLRTHAVNGFASVTYAITSALILSPLLWESTVRFHILSPAFSATVLVGFVVLAFALAWRRELYVVPWAAMLMAVVTALALVVATHELVPLTAALLTLALVTEIAACLGHHLTLRAAPALAVNLAVLLLVDVMTSAEGVPPGYPPASSTTLTLLCLALLAIYGGSIGIRTFWMRKRITVFEITQGSLAFLIGVFGAIRASHGSVTPVLDILFLLLAAACYWVALSRFAEELPARNRRVFVTWAATLLLAVSVLLFPTSIQAPFLCLAAVAAAFVYMRTTKVSLGVHASLFLATATAVSPLPNYVVNALAKTVPTSPGWIIWIVAASAALCYAVGLRRLEDQRTRRILQVVPAVLVSFACAALAVAAVVWLANGRLELTAPRLSVIRTVVNCALALALGFLGSRWRRGELGWVAYAAVAFGTLKLLFEDLRYGNAASLVVSLLFYGLILILLPRLTEGSRNETLS